jgi:hypothetical protein
MIGDKSKLEILATRAGFNSALRHIRKTLTIIRELETDNLGDILFEMGKESREAGEAPLILAMLLADKLGYKTCSINLRSTAKDIKALAAEFQKWKAVDLVAAYHHPDMGLILANPKAARELEGFGVLRKRELLVIYAGKGLKPADEICARAAGIAAAMFEGAKPLIPAALTQGPFTAKKPPAKAPGKNAQADSPSPALSSPVQGLRRMTAMYSVPVSNELFHNGNVEAWKRIIESYKDRYPESQVYLYYEGERILNINSLFKWGKVKHGRSIQFAVAGREIRDIVKLRRYLIQGASPDFEAFLRGPATTLMKLF